MRSITSQKAVVAVALIVAAAGTIGVLRCKTSHCSKRAVTAPTVSAGEGSEAAPLAKDPRLVLRRPWFDRLPKKRTDEIELWIFFGGGFGLHDKGSMWRSTVDFFDFERRGSTVDIVFLQDKKKQVAPFEIVECHDKPPFDLCLDVKDPLRGKTRLWSWDDDADMDAAVPWAREWRASAETRARSIR